MPFASGDTNRTLTLTASEDIDGLSEVLSIVLVTTGISGYTVTSTASEATRTLTMTDNEPEVILSLPSLLRSIREGSSDRVRVEVRLLGLVGTLIVNIAISGVSPGDARDGAGLELAALTSLTLSDTTILGRLPGAEKIYLPLDDGVPEGDETWTIAVLPGDRYRVPQGANPVSFQIIIQDPSP